MQLKRGNQKPRKSKNLVEYEIKTYGNNVVGRNKSPTYGNKQYNKRSLRSREPDDEEDAPEEMAYMNPNEINNSNQKYSIRSPLKYQDSKNISKKLRETERAQKNEHSEFKIPEKALNLEKNRREKLRRSPKTINLGETPLEVENNIKSINRPKRRDKEKSKDKDRDKDKDGSVIERTYNMITNEAGNIFLDQPIHQKSFINQQEVIDARASFDSKDIKDIQCSMNPRDFHEPLSGFFEKMSPKGNIEADSDTNSEKNENIENKNKELRTQIEKRKKLKARNDDETIEGNKPIKNELEKIEDLVKRQESKGKENNITEEEVKKLVKLYLKGNDPKTEGEGRLISNKQTVLPSIKEDLFTDRYKVLQKMNKLSNILLSKRKSINNYEISTLNRSFGEGRSFDKTTLNNTALGTKKGTIKGGKQHKFLFISLAMLSAKGDERTILRRMRLDKGGVVDLAQENAKKKKKFKIKKFKAMNRGQNMINPKYKEKAAKIVQAWWRDQKAKYKNILNQIVKIQSVWRGKFTRKYVYDIIYLSYLHQRFFDIMEKTLVNHTRPIVWDELFSRTKLAKSTLRSLLERKDRRFTLLRIRPYFRKWNIIANFLRNRILKSRALVIKKGDNKQKKTILKKYLDKWNLKANIDKYIGKSKNAEKKRHKLIGAYHMLNGLKTHTKKVSFKQISVPVKNHFNKVLKQKLLTKIINNYTYKSLRLQKENAINKWKNAVARIRLTNLKAKIFVQNITHVGSILDRVKLRYYINKWRRHVPTGKRVLDIQEGTDLLKKFKLKNAYIDILNAFKEKCEAKNMHNKMATIFVIKRRKIREKIRKYLNKWNKKTIKVYNKKRKNKIYHTLLKNVIINIEKRILYKHFNRWRQRPKIDIYYEFSKVRDFTDVLSKFFKNNIRPEKYDFFDKLDTTRANRALEKSANKIFKNYKKKQRRLLRHYFYKWRGQTKNSEITELQNQLLKYLFISKQNRLNRLILAKYMARWRLFVNDKNHYNNMIKLKRVYKGGDILENMKNRRIRNFIIRLYRKMGKDYRPIILDKLTKKLEKPRATVGECLEKWRRINEKGKALETITSMKARFLYKGKRRINKRTKRDILMKAFFRWRVLCRKPGEYYPKITRGFNFMTKYAKKILCRKAFDLVYMNRNYDRKLKKLLKNYENRKKKLLNGKLRNLFGRWRKKANDKNIKNLKGNILFRTKINLDKNLRLKLLTKYFTRWKIYRRKGLDVNFSKGIKLLTNLYRRPFYDNILEAYLNKVDQISKIKAANKLVKATNRYSKNLLRNAFEKMFIGAIKIDPNRMRKIKTRLRRIIKRNEEEPRAKAFHRWKKQIKLMKFREKDLSKACKIIYNRLLFNDKLNLNQAMSRWKKKIQQIREQYLKSLIVKQIKSSQNVKTKMNNQTKLRAALLKWRAALAPVNYLDRLKHIKKGCKIFKRGLKKRDERQLFDGISSLAKKNRKKFLLKKIINVINPNLDKYKMKQCISIWKNKLEDTQRMKNKMSMLLEDYLYSDTIHEGLIADPVYLLMEAMKKYNKIKIEKAKKINEFAKGILLAKDMLNKLKLTLKMRKLFEKKKKDEDYIKRMNLRRFHRNVQKIKNNQNARIIQRFIKVKLRRYFDKRKLIAKGVEEFNQYLKKKCFYNIKDKAKENLMKKVLKTSIKKQEKNKKNVLLHFLNKWRNIIPEIEKNESAIKIQNLFRNFKSRQILSNLEKREDLLIKIHKKYERKNKQIITSNLREWLNKAIMLKNKQNARIIQRYVRTKMLFHKLKVVQNKLRKLFIKDAKYQLCKVMERSSRIIGGKGEVVYKAIQDILYRNPFDKFMDNLKFTAKVNTLRNIQPKIHDTIKNYYLPKYLQKWKHKTYDQSVKYSKYIQKFLRIQYIKKEKRNKIKRKELLKKIIAKKQKNDLYKLQLPFNIWHKKAILAQANENANIIQTNFRAYMARKRTDEALAKQQLKKLFRFNQLRNIVNKIKKAGNRKILNTNKKIILNIILKKKAFTDDKSALKRYFDRWRQYNTYTNNCATTIANSFRTYLAKKEKNRLQKIKNILIKCVKKHNKIDMNTKKSKLRKWRKKSKLISYDVYCRKIQKFMRPKLAKKRNKKFKKYFFENAEKKIKKLLLMAAKFNKIKKIVERPSLKRFNNNLKVISLKNNQNEKLGKIMNKKDKKTNKLLLRKYLQKWFDKVDEINEVEYESATLLQNAFRAYKAKKFAKKNLFIKKVLKKNVIKKSKINSNIIYSSFKRWLNVVKNLTMNKNVLVIQMFCTQILFKIYKENELSRKIKVNNFIKKICNIKFGAKYALDKIKERRDKECFTQFNNILKLKRIKILKDVFSKIKKRAFNNKLRSALKIPGIFHGRILKRILEKWNENAFKIASKHGAEMIQKNWRIYSYKKKQENKKGVLKHLLLKLIEKKSNIKYKYFMRLQNQTLKKTKEIQKAKIAKYFKDRFKISEARKKWKNLCQKCYLNNRNNDIFNVINKMKQYIALNKLKEPLLNNAQTTIMNLCKDKIRKKNILDIFEYILPEINDKNNYDALVKYLGKWKIKAKKLKNREEKIKKAMEIISRNDLDKNIDLINNVMLVKKIFNNIPKIRAKLFLRKLRKIKINKKKYEKLTKSVKNAKNEFLEQHKLELMNKIYKIYAYHKISKMLNVFNEKLHKKIKPLYAKDFLKKLYENLRRKKQYKYGNQIKSESRSRTTKLKYKKSTTLNKAEDIVDNKMNLIKKIIPHFVKYLNNKIKNRRKDIFEKIEEEAKRKHFAKTLNIYSKKIILKPKKEMVNFMHRDALYSESRPLYQIKLFKLFRKRYIHELAVSLEEPAEIYHLYYLINVTDMHKKIAKQRFYRELIRKWRFAAFAKKMAKKKLELMYKNLHASYLQMADEFFGEETGSLSVIKEFEMFGNNMGMFTGENPQIGEELNKKYYTNVEKKYIFANGQEEDEKVEKVKKKVKKKASKKEKVEKKALKEINVIKEVDEEEDEENKNEIRKSKKDPFLKYKKSKA